MKKILSLIAIVMLAVGVCQARDEYSRDASVLPAKARTLISQHFAGKTIHHIKIDRGAFGHTEYDVVLNNGAELDFDKNGQLQEVECGSDGVPAGLILKDISRYVSNNYKRDKIVRLDIEKGGYEVELASGVELKFDRAGRFLKVDD